MKQFLLISVILMQAIVGFSQTVKISGRVGAQSASLGYVPKNFVASCLDLVTGDRIDIDLDSASFLFDGLTAGHDYKVWVYHTSNEDYLNGVSTLDIVMVSRHILGISPLDHITKRIAADANNDRKISAADIIELRKLILGIQTTLYTSWKVVTNRSLEENTFPLPSSNLTDTYIFTNLSENISDADFTLVKIGDINGNSQ